MICGVRRVATRLHPSAPSHVLAASLGEYTWFDSASQELITRQQCSSSVLKSHKGTKTRRSTKVLEWTPKVRQPS